jgi:hypothetical protein
MTQENEGKSRRDFLKLAGIAAPAVVAMTASGTQAQAEPAQADLTSETMQDTAHTRAYFKSARF